MLHLSLSAIVDHLVAILVFEGIRWAIGRLRH
jgi:hypothetical protein